MAVKKKSWRDVIEVHPSAEVFPMMSEAELVELAKDIRKNTLQVPVATWEQLTPDGPRRFLLDGRNRLDAMERAGIPVVNPEGTGLLDHVCDETSSMSSFTAGGVVVALNIHRRHLTKQQIAEYALLALRADKELLASFRNPSSEPVGHDDPPVPRPAPGRSGTPANKGEVAEVAEATGISRETVKRAKKNVDAKGTTPKPPAKKPAPKPEPAPKLTPAEAKAKKDAAAITEQVGFAATLTKEYERSMKTTLDKLSKMTLTAPQRAAVARQAEPLKELMLRLAGIGHTTTLEGETA